MDVAIVGLGLHPFGRTASMSGLEQGAAAVRAALADAGTDFKAMQFAFGGSQDSGNADSLVNPAGVKDWYRRLVEANGGLEATQRFARFFVAPGVDHCRGGRGLDRFDPVSALQAWVERGVAPETLPSTGASFPGRTRMLCAWPKIARYKGQGSVDDAASFACVNP